MPKRPCMEPGCPEWATYRGRCPTHARSRERVTHRNKGIYGTRRWAYTRRQVLFNQPLCSCGEISTDVHHRVDLSDGGDPWALSNLESLCHACHARLTRAAQIESRGEVLQH